MNNDVATMSTDANVISIDVSIFQSEISTFNTKAQYVNDSKINGIIGKVNTALSALENDYSDTVGRTGSFKLLQESDDNCVFERNSVC